jgi:urease beta subunit
MTSQKTLRDGAITRVDITPPQAIPTQPNPSQPVFTITNTDTQSVTVWITHEGTSINTKVDTDAAAEPGSEPTPVDLQYRDAETGERLSGADVTVTLEPGEERVVGVVADAGASDSASNATAGVASSAITTTTTATANVHIRHSRAGGAR